MRAAITAAILVVTGVLATSSAFAQGKWISLKPIPQGEEEVYGTAAGGKLYVLGGLGIFPGWEPKQMLWSFDPASSEWTRLPNIPEGIHHPGFAAVGDKLYSVGDRREAQIDRKSTRLNSSHLGISYAVFCLKKKKNK